MWLLYTGTANSLTGEGHAHEKVVTALEPAVRTGDVAEDALPVSHGHGVIPLAECKNMVFMGTLACGGHAKAVVTATGKTENMVRVPLREVKREGRVTAEKPRVMLFGVTVGHIIVWRSSDGSSQAGGVLTLTCTCCVGAGAQA